MNPGVYGAPRVRRTPAPTAADWPPFHRAVRPYQPAAGRVRALHMRAAWTMTRTKAHYSHQMMLAPPSDDPHRAHVRSALYPP